MSTRWVQTTRKSAQTDKSAGHKSDLVLQDQNAIIRYRCVRPDVVLISHAEQKEIVKVFYIASMWIGSLNWMGRNYRKREKRRLRGDGVRRKAREGGMRVRVSPLTWHPPPPLSSLSSSICSYHSRPKFDRRIMSLCNSGNIRICMGKTVVINNQNNLRAFK